MSETWPMVREGNQSCQRPLPTRHQIKSRLALGVPNSFERHCGFLLPHSGLAGSRVALTILF